MASSDPRAQIDALLALINSSAQQAMAYYENSGAGIPTLNDPHPNDDKVDSLPFRKSIQTLEGAFEQLRCTLASPMHVMTNRSMGHFEIACLRVAVHNHIADILKKKPDGMHISELSKETGIESKKLSRILTLLATKHCFREVAPDVFANTRLSRMLSADGHPSLVELETVELCIGTIYLQDTLEDPDYGASYEPSKAPFAYITYKDQEEKGDLFTFLGAHPKRSEMFNRSMIDYQFVTMSSLVVTGFPWKDLPAGTTVCDVGGGIGILHLKLAKAYPHLQLTLQDQAHVLEEAPPIWKTECPQALAEDRIKFVPINFFTQSPVAGQDIYFLGNIIHDWPDEDSLKILRGVRKVMTPDTRLLIQDIVLQRVYQDEASSAARFTAKAPYPLLPNYGAGNIRAYNMDINLMCCLNAQERKLDEWIALGARAGLELRKAWDVAEHGLLEFRISELDDNFTMSSISTS
ncbi:hypothetical protein PLICRDRAFT_179817 [Plicaturopsis crispa FD-325 SS-3]|uniref:S-adenosyl-L-methionine-dependent methyltransferase n=1 Tax=Plicaturopsis crispa FD-325 SS-3 TaxID=944288 RepID=A0A0C9SQX7_PLICR|nr:hypothetical protein PLICRDRAFT_179817 [Plicaturopsis crispa FD-325 SS-3]